MQPLNYKYIGSEEHLSFDSIRRFVFHQLSDLDETEARQHIGDCYRCRSIYESLAYPAEIRKSHWNSSIGSRVFGGIVLVMVSTAIAVCCLYFEVSTNSYFKDLSPLLSWGLSKIKKTEITILTPNPPEAEHADDFKRIASAPVMETIDTLSGLNGEPDIGAASDIDKQFDTYIGPEERRHVTKLRGIYGKVTANGESLKGVTVMVPDSRTARVTNSDGKYYIQVPGGTASLVFIYQGKQLVKELDPTSRRHDINLEIKSMMYPEIEAPETGSENIVSN